MKIRVGDGRRWAVHVGVLEEVDGGQHRLASGGVMACGLWPHLGLRKRGARSGCSREWHGGLLVMVAQG
jgi:hypothetical protein